MPAVLILTVIIQACFVFHVFKTGRPYWWAYIILGFPALGCIVYYFVEVFPGSREHRSARKAVRDIAKAMKPDAELQRRAEEVQICGSVENKVSLAEECVSGGMFDEAVKLYQSSLSGPHATDPSLLYGLARAQFHSGHYAAARGTLAQLEQAQPAFKPGEVRLLHARIFEGLGDSAGALDTYEKLVPSSVGLEAKCRYALLLKSLGHTKQANSVFEDVLLHAKRFNISHDDERQWVALAQRSLAN